MELTCNECGAKFRAAVPMPLTAPVRVACPACGKQRVVRPEPPPPPSKRTAVIADEPRPFRSFLGEHLRRLGFEVSYFDTGEPALAFIRKSRADLVVVNVYLKGKLGVEVSEAIRREPELKHTRVVLVGALFRANRFRANPTNLYGADEYIEEQIPEKEFRQIVRRLFPEVGATAEMPVEPREYEEARRLARLILSDIIIYHAAKVEKGLRDNTFLEDLREPIEEGRQFYDSRVPLRVRQNTEIFNETLRQFVDLKREEMKAAK